MKNEIWKDVIGYEGFYKVSNFGNIKSLERLVKNYRGGYNLLKEKNLKPGTTRGYLLVVLSKKEVKKSKLVHQLVAESFLNHVPSGMKLVINHKDFNKSNNCVENLEIVTTRENSNKKHIRSSSKYTGVSWHKGAKKWVSTIVFNGKLKHLGCFDNEIEAHNAYQNALNTILIIKK